MNARAEPTLFVAIGASTRRRLEAAVEQLIALLDQLDGDVDLESANDDEPSLGWSTGASASSFDPGDDREAEDEHHEDGGDREPDTEGEPWLGWSVTGNWGESDDRERELTGD